MVRPRCPPKLLTDHQVWGFPIPCETVLVDHSSEPGRHGAGFCASIQFSLTPHVIPGLGTRKWRLREVRQLAQGRTGFGPRSL